MLNPYTFLGSMKRVICSYFLGLYSFAYPSQLHYTPPRIAANIASLNFVALESSRANLIFSASSCTPKSDSSSGTDKPSGVRVRPFAIPDNVSRSNIVEARASSGS